MTLDSPRSANPLLVSGIAYPSVMHDWFGEFDASLGLTWDWDWYLRLTKNGVPLRRIEGSSVSGIHARNRAQPRHVVSRKHALQQLNLLPLEQPQSLKLIASD